LTGIATALLAQQRGEAQIVRLTTPELSTSH
jgi:hypothetical protein